MTDANTRNRLEQAYGLIQQEELDKAIEIIRPIVTAQPNNSDAWWLLANAVSEPKDAYEALSNVVRLEPNHPQARELLDNLLGEFPDLAKSSGTLRSATLSSPTDFNDLFSSAIGANEKAASTDSGSFNMSSPTESDSNYDLDSFFAASSPISSASPEEEADLDAFFGAGADTSSDAPKGKRGGASGTQFQDEELDPFFAPAPAASDKSSRPNKRLEKADKKAPKDPFADSLQEPGFVKDGSIEGKRASKPKAAPRRAPVPATPVDPLELEKRANRRRSPILTLLLLILVIAIVGGGAYLIIQRNNGGNPQTGTTAGTAQPNATVSANAGAQIAILNGLKSIGLTDDNKLSTASANGTLNIQFCSLPGPDLKTKIFKAIDVIADPVASQRTDVKVTHLEISNCSNGGLLYGASAPIDAITKFVDGGKKDRTTYRAAWTTN